MTTYLHHWAVINVAAITTYNAGKTIWVIAANMPWRTQHPK